MGRECLANGSQCVEQNRDKVTCDDSKFILKPGDTTWVKARGFSWWPAQVVPENSVSKKCKPRKRTESAVLVRLYGCYEYVYVEPQKTLPKFDRVLKQHKGNHWDIIEKAFEQIVPEVVSRSSQKQNLRSGGKRERQCPQENRKAVEDSVCKKAKTDKPISETPTPPRTQEISERRLKVMQVLGLMAPNGSPFYKNGPMKPMA